MLSARLCGSFWSEILRARSVGMGEDQLDLITSLLSEDAAIFPAQTSSFLKARVQDTLSHTWFLTAGDDQPVLTSKGTRPGDPLADLMFAFVLKGVLKDCNAGISQAGLNLRAATAGILPSVQPGTYAVEPSLSWHDDCAFVFVSTAPATLRDAASNTLHLVERAFCARGLSLTLAPVRQSFCFILWVKGINSPARSFLRHRNLRFAFSQKAALPPECVSLEVIRISGRLLM